MATTPRLTFLYPAFFRSAFSHSSPSCRVPSKFRSLQQSGYKTTCRKQQEEVRSRYGTANEPPPHLAANDRPAQKKASRASKASKSEIGASYTPEDRALPKPEDKAAGEKKKGKDVDSSADHSALEKSTIDSSLETLPTKETSEVLREGSESPTHVEQPATAIKPLEKMLDIEPSPSSSSSSSSSTQEQEEGKSSHTHRPPHLVTPPYVHHFDTYTLVRNLENSGGFSQDQAVTCMKAVRSLLSTNMDLARAGLVSKSDVENESYLFKAACSELKTEIQNKRRQEVETMRTERTQLQHEFDILNQRVGQETAGLKDELKGMFDDRKMGVRMEQKAMESTVRLFLFTRNMIYTLGILQIVLRCIME